MSKTEKMPLNTNVMAKTTKLMPKTQMWCLQHNDD
jgi:hypothetical protein